MSKRCLLKSSLLLVCGLLSISVAGFADSLPLCVPEMRMSFLNQNGGCAIGSMVFTNFGFQLDAGLRFDRNGPYVTADNILITATEGQVTFSTDYGPGGGFQSCSNCVEIESAVGYSMYLTTGNLIFGGVHLEWVPFVSEIACYGAGNIAQLLGAGLGGYDPSSPNFQNPCSDSSRFAYLRDGISAPEVAHFGPASAISATISLFAEPGGGVIPPVSNEFLLIPEPSALSIFLSVISCFAFSLVFSRQKSQEQSI